MKDYNPSKIESKWQKRWEKGKDLSQANDFAKKPKKYILVEFPYPSGDGLHVGHIRSYSAFDAIARQKRMQGFNVLYPIGWDAFGLPTENYAIRTGIHPREATDKNVANFKKQMKSLGLSFDWSREIDTTDPKYYKWTQWIFLKFFEKGLAYQAEMPINWCPSCKIGLANEEVIEGKCERCGALTQKRNIKQWILKITAYADKLIKGLKEVDYPERVKAQQINWIGRSEGVEIDFPIVIVSKAKQSRSNTTGSLRPFTTRDDGHVISIFTTRADTIFGVTALVLAPEQAIINKLKDQIKNWQEVNDYIKKAKRKSELERTSEAKERTGVELKGIKAINPANNEKVPIWVADYVLAHYGGGAVMMVPAHDKRDFDFAKKYKLEIKPVIIPDLGHIKNGKKVPDMLKVVEEVSAAFNKKRIKIWFNGTFGVAGYYGKFFTEPEDVDCGVLEKDFNRARSIIEGLGFKKIEDKANPNFKVSAYRKNNIVLEIGTFDHDLGNQMATIDDLKYCIPDAKWLAECYRITVNKERRRGKNDFERAIFLELVSGSEKEAYVEYGVLINSGKFSGMPSQEAIEEIAKWLEKKGLGRKKVQYKLRDWIFSRQHYWGEPIPLVFCTRCKKIAESTKSQITNPKQIPNKKYKIQNSIFNTGEILNPGWIAVPENQLPVELPYVKNYQPTDTGESPLANIKKWVNVKCPKCKGPAKRETDTMPNWAGSSWYFLRYADPKNNKAFADSKKLKYWTPVDLYNGGMEHTTLHLLYSRFWHKFLYDLKLVPTSEPYAKRTSHGIVLAEDRRKMSKSFGNVINPDEIVKIYGADSLRVYEMFMGPFDQAISWSHNGLVGCYRFLERIHNYMLGGFAHSPFYNEKDLKQWIKGDFKVNTPQEIKVMLNKSIKKIGEDLENLKFNTAVSQLMILRNSFYKEEDDAKPILTKSRIGPSKTGRIIEKSDFEKFLILLAPFAPHLAEELWQKLGNKKSIFYEKWPEYDPKLIKEETFELVVQINGKVRDKIEAPIDISEKEAQKLALASEKIQKWVEGKKFRKVIFVKNRLVNITL